MQGDGAGICKVIVDDRRMCAAEQISSQWMAEQAGSRHCEIFRPEIGHAEHEQAGSHGKLRGAHIIVHENPRGDPWVFLSALQNIFKAELESCLTIPMASQQYRVEFSIRNFAKPARIHDS